MKTDVGEGFRVTTIPERLPLVEHKKNSEWCGPVVMEGDQVWCASTCGPIGADAKTTATVRRLEAEWEKWRKQGDEEADLRERAKRWGLNATQIERLARPNPRPEVKEMTQQPLFFLGGSRG